jgi:hypothetical protein
MRKIAIVAATLLASIAGTEAATPPPPAPDCSVALHRQLDFWVGEWKVFVAGDDTTQIATSRIERVMNGCGIQENYSSPHAPGGAYAGTSYSGYDRKDGKWHQMYVDTNENVTWYTGGLEGADMVLTAPAKSGAIQKMIYRPHPDGSVEQIGTVSTDGGATWQAGYDYFYRK